MTSYSAPCNSVSISIHLEVERALFIVGKKESEEELLAPSSYRKNRPLTFHMYSLQTLSVQFNNFKIINLVITIVSHYFRRAVRLSTRISNSGLTKPQSIEPANGTTIKPLPLSSTKLPLGATQME